MTRRLFVLESRQAIVNLKHKLDEQDNGRSPKNDCCRSEENKDDDVVFRFQNSERNDRPNHPKYAAYQYGEF